MGNFIKKKYNSGMTNIASYIDHTLLRPDATVSDINKLCDEAILYEFASICVAPCWADLVSKRIKSPTKLCIVRNFPHGNLSQTMDGGFGTPEQEIDYVMNVGFVKSGLWDMVDEDFRRMRLAGTGASKIIKVIVEIGYLTDDELLNVADLLIKHNIDFIKTCTGYGPRGVTVEDIAKIKKHVGDRIKIKASGGIKTYEFCKQLIDAGADRIGCSNSINIIKESSNGGQGTELGSNPASY